MSPRCHRPRLGQFLAEHDGVGLAQHGFVHRDGGGIFLRGRGGGQGNQGGEAEEIRWRLFHGNVRFVQSGAVEYKIVNSQGANGKEVFFWLDWSDKINSFWLTSTTT